MPLPMVIFRPTLASEAEPVLDLIARAFPRDWALRPDVRAAVVAEPDYGPPHGAVGVASDDTLVAHAVAKEAVMSLGPVTLPVVRVGTVCVDPRHRRQGLGQRVVEAAVWQMPEGLPVVLDPAAEPEVVRFYERQGFVAVQRSLTVATIARDRLPAPGAARPAELADLPALARLYEQHYGPQPGSFDRTEAWWRARLAGRPMLWAKQLPRLWVAPAEGRVVAYLFEMPGAPEEVWEWAAEPGAGAAALGLLAAVEATGPTLRLDFRPDDPLAAALAPLAPVLSDESTRQMMVRAGSPDRLAGPLGALWASRGARLEPTAGGAILRVGEASLSADWTHLLALAWDGRPLDDWLAAERVTLSAPDEAARRALEAVVPVRAAARRQADAY